MSIFYDTKKFIEGVMIAIECKAYADNIKHDSMTRKGIAHFEVRQIYWDHFKLKVEQTRLNHEWLWISRLKDPNIKFYRLRFDIYFYVIEKTNHESFRLW